MLGEGGGGGKEGKEGDGVRGKKGEEKGKRKGREEGVVPSYLFLGMTFKAGLFIVAPSIAEKKKIKNNRRRDFSKEE